MMTGPREVWRTTACAGEEAMVGVRDQEEEELRSGRKWVGREEGRAAAVQLLRCPSSSEQAKNSHGRGKYREDAAADAAEALRVPQSLHTCPPPLSTLSHTTSALSTRNSSLARG